MLEVKRKHEAIEDAERREDLDRRMAEAKKRGEPPPPPTAGGAGGGDAGDAPSMLDDGDEDLIF